MSAKAASILASVPGAPDDPFDVNPTAGNGSSGASTSGRRSRFQVSTTSLAPVFSMLEPSLDLSSPSNQVAAAVASAVDAPPSGSAANNGERNLLANSHGRMRENPLEVIREFASFTAGTEWRSYTDYIGAPVQYPGYSDAVKKRIVESEAVRQKVAQLVERRWRLLGMDNNGDAGLTKRREMERELFEVADTMADKMVAKQDSLPFLRFFGATVNNILVRMYDQGIHLSQAEFLRFRAGAQHAAARGESMIILPCHRSHLDYLTISWLFFRLGLSMPHIVAGENLDLPVVGSMLQKCGAFFIRRTFGEDELYPVVVREYIEQLLSTGHNIECFIEGTRSRTGKLLPPKLGILKYIVEGVMRGRTTDVWICPISVQYDKVIESETYVNELLGNPKEKESLWGLITNTRVLQLKMGRIDVRFQEPWSLREFISAQAARRSSIPSSPSFDIENNPAHKYALLRALGYQVLWDINAVAVVMPAALVGTVLLTLRGRGISRGELIRRTMWLCDAIRERGGRVADFGAMSLEEVVDRAVGVMSDLIGTHTALLEPTYFAIKRFELSFYRNQVIHLFVNEAMLCAALYTRVKQGGTIPSQRMPKDRLIDELIFLSTLLSNEFVFGTKGIVQNSEETLKRLEADQVITIDDESQIGLSLHERSIGREHFDVYCFMIWPFIETYWLAAVSLFSLTPKLGAGVAQDELAWVSEKEFQSRAQLLGKSLFYQGDVSYLEAINQATLLNSYQRLVEMGVLRSKRGKPSGAKAALSLLALDPDWRPVRFEETGRIKGEGKLWSFLERLGAFRREGKNRRDNATIATRVLDMADLVALPVLETSGAPPPQDASTKL